MQALYYPQGELNQIAGAATPLYYVRDHLGSVMQAVDAADQVKTSQRYSAYGVLSPDQGNGPVKNPTTFGYAGMWRHGESGLNLTWFRAYDPSSGRWLSRNPIEEAGGLNLYGYARLSPVIYFDPLDRVWITTDVNYHGINNWAIGVANRLGSLDEGRVVSMYECVDCTRDLKQEWEPDPNDPACNKNTPTPGDSRTVLQTFNEYPDEWAINGRSWHWSPVIPMRSWE